MKIIKPVTLISSSLGDKTAQVNISLHTTRCVCCFTFYYWCLVFLLASYLPVYAVDLVKLKPVPFTDVTIADSFWRPKQETNRVATLPINFENLEKSGNINNLRLAAARATNGYTGPVFMDSDVYKAIEAASYSLATHPDPKLEKQLDDLIEILAKAQLPDGYLNSYYIVKEPGRRWTNLRDNHELYCAGHLIEAAVAHYQATGKRNLLDVAIKLANHIDSVFGPPPKRLGYPGHPEIELALIKLWHVTNDRRYFELAKFFVENRGKKYFAMEHNIPIDRYDGSYWQDDVPITEHKNIKGHAVRAAYLMSGVTDVATETENPLLLRMLNRVWKNTVYRNLYITGGIGPSAHNEGFTVDYDLPNLTAYQETCASVALAQWNHRLCLLYGDAKFADVFERSLYNGVIAGVSQDGTRFFYVNPLESAGTHHRSEWFGCACCPPNVARTIASIGGYAYATGTNDLYVNLFIQGRVTASINNQKVTVAVKTDYPWNGQVEFEFKLDSPTSFAIHLRNPQWCNKATIAINDILLNNPQIDHGYFVISNTWKSGDKITLLMQMPVQKIIANPNVKADRGLIALQRGPIVYCLEQCDQPQPLDKIYIGLNSDITFEKTELFPNGIVVIKGDAELTPELDWSNSLYQPMPKPKKLTFKAIPYYAWDNRKAGPMKVWMPLSPVPQNAGGLEALAKVSLSFVSGNCQPWGINDGVEPTSSSQQPAALCHWWPHKGTTEWVQYNWPKPIRAAGAKVYWFDDTGRGECKLPEAWEIQWLDNGQWKPVEPEPGAEKINYHIQKDHWNEVSFKPVTTTALRLVVKLQKDWAAGIHEWKIIEPED